VLANPDIEWSCRHAEQTYNALMDNDLDLRDFANVTRLFPLPNLVMFPHVVLPLHVFEPRYRQMTEDALAGDRLITIIQITPPAGGEHRTEPVPLEPVGCLGRIIQHERLADGRFNLLLLGRKRVRLLREIATEKLYRIAAVDILQDQPATLPEEPARAELIGLFRQFFESHRKLDPDLAEFLNKPVPLGLLEDIISYALDLPLALKQRLLAENSVDRRVDTIRSVLRQVTPGKGQHGLFPPPFSVN
jgi:Lon protease-like protein